MLHQGKILHQLLLAHVDVLRILDEARRLKILNLLAAVGHNDSRVRHVGFLASIVSVPNPLNKHFRQLLNKLYLWNIGWHLRIQDLVRVKVDYELAAECLVIEGIVNDKLVKAWLQEPRKHIVLRRLCLVFGGLILHTRRLVD